MNYLIAPILSLFFEVVGILGSICELLANCISTSKLKCFSKLEFAIANYSSQRKKLDHFDFFGGINYVFEGETLALLQNRNFNPPTRTRSVGMWYLEWWWKERPGVDGTCTSHAVTISYDSQDHALILAVKRPKRLSYVA